MKSDANINKLAKMFKHRDNILYSGPLTGTVISPPPNLRVWMNDKLILEPEDIVLAASVLNGYQRQISIKEARTVSSSSISEIEGKLSFQDTLKVGDEVIVLPSQDEQTYYLIDRAVRL